MKIQDIIYSIILGIAAVGVFKATDIEDTWQNFFIFLLIFAIVGQLIYVGAKIIDEN